jgi:HPt (histidine-containing phosphotransfer) domain-containing protein
MSLNFGKVWLGPDNGSRGSPAGPKDANTWMKTKMENSTIDLKGLSPTTDLRSLVESGVGEMIPHIIGVFLESATQDLERMRTAVLACDPQALAVAAHSLKGSCSILGASRLQELCLKVESDSGEPLGAASTILEPLDEEFSRVRTELQAALD